MKKLILALLTVMILLSGCSFKSPTIDELEQLFVEAEEAYAWFTSTNEIETDYNVRIEHEFGYYALVTRSGITSMQSLSDYLHKYFEDDIVKDLLSRTVWETLPMFQEVDGQLYYHVGNLALWDWDAGVRTFSVTSTTDYQIILSIHYDIIVWEDTISTDLSYIINKSEDGIWKFASPYQLPVQAASEIRAKSQ